MSDVARWSVLLLLALALTPGRAGALYRCSCEVSFEDIPEGTGAVFLGKVVRVSFLDPLEDDVIEPRIIVELEVVRNWMGAERRTFVLHTFYNKTSCDGYWFEEGRTYVIPAFPNAQAFMDQAWPPRGTFGTLYCGVHELEDAQELIARLDAQFLRPRNDG